MNDTNSLNGLIIETIRDVKGGVGKSVDFLLEQAPDVANQLLAFKFVEHILCAAGILLLFCAALWLLRIAIKRKWYQCDSEPEFWGFMTAILFLIITGCATLFEACPEIVSAVKVKVAPKVYLIEYCSELLK